VDQVAAHGVGGAFVPGAAFLGLLRRKDVDETRAKRIEMEAFLDVPVQRGGEKLGEQEDAV